MALTFTTFLGEDVAQMRLLTLERAISTLAETLCSAAVGFHLRHLLSPNIHSLRTNIVLGLTNIPVRVPLLKGWE